MSKKTYYKFDKNAQFLKNIQQREGSHKKKKQMQ